MNVQEIDREKGSGRQAFGMKADSDICVHLWDDAKSRLAGGLAGGSRSLGAHPKYVPRIKDWLGHSPADFLP